MTLQCINYKLHVLLSLISSSYFDSLSMVEVGGATSALPTDRSLVTELLNPNQS